MLAAAAALRSAGPAAYCATWALSRHLHQLGWRARNTGSSSSSSSSSSAKSREGIAVSGAATCSYANASLVDTKARLIDKLLIANRGEIACRIIKTARRLGIRTAAVYSEPDRHALHASLADEALCVGPAQSLQSYHNADAIIRAAKACGAQAVHPGYGFMSEDADFAERVVGEGLIWVGPPPSAIRLLGDKVESKRTAIAAGIPVVPGPPGPVTDIATALDMAAQLGYPVIIKAKAGGGGKGIRPVHNDLELREMLPLARAEAAACWGNDELLLEKLLVGARHIEVQVLGDHFGNLVALPERECSVQRRNQKVLEESPSPAVTPELRSKLGAAAVALARSVGYNSTGTVEFMVDKDQNWYFLEMNTRLQVEHPVTEAVTGLDLVEAMIRIAGNQRLQLTQEDAGRINGWAVEARICAEDPANNFSPAPGLIKVYREPQGPGLRVDAGVVEGSEVLVHYDPLLSKVITWAPSRSEAIAKMADALDLYVVRGVATNIPFLRHMLDVGDFKEGNYATDFIPTHYGGPHGLEPEAYPLTLHQQQDLEAAAVYLYTTRALRFHPGFLGPAGRAELTVTTRDMHAGNRRPQHVLVRRAGPQMVGEAAAAGGALEVQLPQRVAYCYASPHEPGPTHDGGRYTPYLHHLVIDGRAMCLQVAKYIPRGMILQHHGAQRAVYVETPAAASLSRHMPLPHESSSERVVTSPMTGTLVELCLQKGAQVRVGDDLLVIEAMKMRNSIKAKRSGYVQEVMVQPGQLVTTGMPLMKLW